MAGGAARQCRNGTVRCRPLYLAMHRLVRRLWHSSGRSIALEVIFEERLRSMQRYDEATAGPSPTSVQIARSLSTHSLFAPNRSFQGSPRIQHVQAHLSILCCFVLVRTRLHSLLSASSPCPSPEHSIYAQASAPTLIPQATKQGLGPDPPLVPQPIPTSADAERAGASRSLGNLIANNNTCPAPPFTKTPSLKFPPVSEFLFQS